MALNWTEVSFTFVKMKYTARFTTFCYKRVLEIPKLGLHFSLLWMGEDSLVAETSPKLRVCKTAASTLLISVQTSQLGFLSWLYNCITWRLNSSVLIHTKLWIRTVREKNPCSMELTMSPPPQNLRPTKMQGITHRVIPLAWQDTPEKLQTPMLQGPDGHFSGEQWRKFR